ncbi:substrate-binding domain-containing protein [Paraliomyxa miuraensis]|uniref:hypothetical protein n=1 Tax=Paraliomyxa miuraensis TaxID=376150 RepID=UPI0022584C1D|nr:hypothetical protein [Paraliomyxa miuraensis]MCX4244111.1 hypothetical protein [Paraliomyxa miuraensis]
MRRVIVFGSLVGMLGAVAGMTMLRERPELLEPAVDALPGEAAGASSSETKGEAAKTDGEAKGEAGETKGEASEAEAAAVDPSKPPEPLRVVALGWEVLAPGVLANGGTSSAEEGAYRKAGLDVSFAAVVDAAEIQTRLSRGGEDEQGADVALMPLPAFVASYERLRALSPQVFFVVAWSRGRDALVGDAALLREPPSGPMRLVGRPGSSETLLGLYVLDEAGVAPGRVELLEPGSSQRRGLQAVQRRRSGEIDARQLVVSTADATHLVPVVAVAAAGVVDRRRDVLVRWARTWMEGARSLDADPAAAARVLAAQKGAPEAVDLIDALGWLEFTDLHGAATAAGLSGRGAVNLDALFHRTWDLWREVGLLTTPSPERVPLTATVIADLARDAQAPAAASRRATSEGEAPVLLVHAVAGRKLDAAAEAALVAHVGTLAGVFSRSTIEVWVPRSPEAGQRVAVGAVERFGLPEGRITVRRDRDPKARKAAVVTVRAAR